MVVSKVSEVDNSSKRNTYSKSSKLYDYALLAVMYDTANTT